MFRWLRPPTKRTRRRARLPRLRLEPLEPRTLPCNMLFSGAQSFATLTVPAGELWCFDPNVSTTVEVTGNVVVRGTLLIAPADPSVTHTLRFTGANEQAFVGGGDQVLPTDVGLWIMGAGTLYSIGAPKIGWARAAGAVAQGATQITLDADPYGWEVGDEITVAPTGYASASQHTQFDQRTITAISGRTLTLNAGTAFAHPAVATPAGTFTAEVMNLTRNVRIEGMPPAFEWPRSGQVNTTGRAHVFVHNTEPAQQILAWTTLRYLGPRQAEGARDSRDVLGRYALHIHESDDNSRGSLIVGVVVRDAGSHAYVPHASNGITFYDTISYNTAGDAYWWDLGAFTDDTVWDRAVAALVKNDPGSLSRQVNGFLLGRSVNVNSNFLTNSVAVGVQGGRSGGGLTSAGFTWPGLGDDIGGVWVFQGNLAHNNKEDGIFVWQVNTTPHVISSFVAYHNGGAGIEHGVYGNAYVYEGVTLYENGRYGLSRNEVTLLAGSRVGGAEGALTFRDFVVDSNGAAPTALFIGPLRSSATLTQLRRWDVRGYTDRAVTVDEPASVSGRYDLVCWTVGGAAELEPGDFRLVYMHPNSLIRVQRANGTAYQIDPSFTVTPIAPFTTCGAGFGDAPPLAAAGDAGALALLELPAPTWGGMLSRPQTSWRESASGEGRETTPADAAWNTRSVAQAPGLLEPSTRMARAGGWPKDESVRGTIFSTSLDIEGGW